MSIDQVLQNVDSQDTIEQLPEEKVREMLAAIERDSRRDPEQFLDESTVPHGGE